METPPTGFWMVEEMEKGEGRRRRRRRRRRRLRLTGRRGGGRRGMGGRERGGRWQGEEGGGGWKREGEKDEKLVESVTTGNKN